MATSRARLAPVNARDGVDTRTKENSVMPCEANGGDNLSVEKITGEGGQLAAWVVPPGADVPGSRMSELWNEWLVLAESHVVEWDEPLSNKYAREDQFHMTQALMFSEMMGMGVWAMELHQSAMAYNGMRKVYLRYMVQPDEEGLFEMPKRLCLESMERNLAQYKESLNAHNRAAKAIQVFLRGFDISETGTYIACDEITQVR